MSASNFEAVTCSSGKPTKISSSSPNTSRTAMKLKLKAESRFYSQEIAYETESSTAVDRSVLSREIQDDLRHGISPKHTVVFHWDDPTGTENAINHWKGLSWFGRLYIAGKKPSHSSGSPFSRLKASDELKPCFRILYLPNNGQRN